jgi:DnaJ family protein B protein 4
MTTHYDILGVSKDAEETDIKKAYRKLSLQYHPDRNPDPSATEKYKAINEAYEILSDSQRREQYNHELEFGSSGFPGGGFPGGGFPGGGFPGGGFPFPGGMGGPDIFNMMFGGGFPGMGGPGIRVFHSNGGPGGIEQLFQQLNRPQSIHKTVSITLQDVYHGKTVPIEIERQSIANNSRSIQKEIIHVSIPPGVEENEIITLEGQGHSIHDFKGDVKINFKIENNTIFTRQGQDIIYTHKISLKEALCGFSFEIKHLSGKMMNMNNIQNPTIIKPGFKKIVPHLGFQKGSHTGNLIIEFLVDFPEVLTGEQIESLRQIL